MSDLRQLRIEVNSRCFACSYPPSEAGQRVARDWLALMLERMMTDSAPAGEATDPSSN